MYRTQCRPSIPAQSTGSPWTWPLSRLFGLFFCLLPSAYFRQLRRGAVVMLRGGTGLGWIKHRPEPASPGHEQMRIREPKGSTALLLALSLLAPSKPTSTETFFWSRRWVELAEHCAVINGHSPAAQCDCIQYGGPANQYRHRWCRVASIVTLSVRLGSWSALLECLTLALSWLRPSQSAAPSPHGHGPSGEVA